jgi:hypothetical protein
MKMQSLAAGAALLAMSSGAWAATHITTHVVHVAEESVFYTAPAASRPATQVDYEREAPLIRIAGKSSRG